MSQPARCAARTQGWTLLSWSACVIFVLCFVWRRGGGVAAMRLSRRWRMTPRGRHRCDAFDDLKSGDAGRHDGKHDVVSLGPRPAQRPRDVDHERRRRGPEDDFVALAMQQIPQRAARLP